jgi:hypothetical protein
MGFFVVVFWFMTPYSLRAGCSCSDIHATFNGLARFWRKRLRSQQAIKKQRIWEERRNWTFVIESYKNWSNEGRRIFGKSLFYNTVLSFFFLSLGMSGTEPTITEATTGLLYQPRMMDDDECGAVGGMLNRQNRSTRRKLSPAAALSTTNPTWSDLGRCGGRQANDRLSYGVALTMLSVFRVYNCRW